MPALYSGSYLQFYANRVITASAELRNSGVTQEGSTNYRVPPLTKDLWNAITAELVSFFRMQLLLFPRVAQWDQSKGAIACDGASPALSARCAFSLVIFWKLRLTTTNTKAMTSDLETLREPSVFRCTSRGSARLRGSHSRVGR